MPQVHIYSDLLYYSWLYINVDLTPFLGTNPLLISPELDRNLTVRVGDNMERRSVKDLSEEEFFTKYNKGNLPIILTDVSIDWPANKLWTMDLLVRNPASILLSSTLSQPPCSPCTFTFSLQLTFTLTLSEDPLQSLHLPFDSLYPCLPFSLDPLLSSTNGWPKAA